VIRLDKFLYFFVFFSTIFPQLSHPLHFQHSPETRTASTLNTKAQRKKKDVNGNHLGSEN